MELGCFGPEPTSSVEVQIDDDSSRSFVPDDDEATIAPPANTVAPDEDWMRDQLMNYKTQEFREVRSRPSPAPPTTLLRRRRGKSLAAAPRDATARLPLSAEGALARSTSRFRLALGQRSVRRNARCVAATPERVDGGAAPSSSRRNQ